MTSAGLVDSHIHLQDYCAESDTGLLVSQAMSAGVTRLVCNGTHEGDWDDVQSFAQLYPAVIPCFGVHPWFVNDVSPDWLSTLDKLVGSTACGVGEIGLDRNRQPFDKAAQEQAFRAQLELARRYGRPAMVHCVRSWGWMMDVLRSEKPLPQGFLMHAYGGSADLISELVEMGAYISFSGKALEPNYERARTALKAMPRDRLLLETDGPCLIPPPRYRAYDLRTAEGEEENHPANLALILEGVAELLGADADDLKATLWENAQRFLEPLMNTKKEQT